MSVWDRPAGDWSDAELDAGVRTCCLRRDELAGQGCVWLADRVNDVLVALVDEQARRAYVYREMASAFAWVADVGWGG